MLIHLLKKKKKNLGVNGSSFTSSAYTPNKIIEEIVFEPKKTTKKGFVGFETNFGSLNFTIHCDLAPLASENFLTHCENGYYNNLNFHRSVKNFMIQGGDPKGTGRGGQSIWGQKFPDEFHKELKHTGGGVLSMANSGPNTNGSQFFITYKSAHHLDGIHTIFGNLSGGKEVLKILENIETDDEEKPKENITILRTIVYFNPLSREELKKDEEERNEADQREKNREIVANLFNNPTPINDSTTGVGKYLNQHNKKRTLNFGTIQNNTPSKKRKKENYGDFSSF